MKRLLQAVFTYILVLLFLYVPILTLIAFSFNASSTMAKWGGFSLKWYGELFTDGQRSSTLWRSPSASRCSRR